MLLNRDFVGPPRKHLDASTRPHRNWLTTMNLRQFRDEINSIDQEILDLLARRRRAVGNVIAVKEENTLQLRDVQREEEVLARLIERGRRVGLDAHAVTKVFHEIIDDSVRAQQQFLQRNRNPQAAQSALTIMYQGTAGNFSCGAARQFFSAQEDSSTFIAGTTFEDVIQAVEKGDADYGVLPVENTIAGVINEVYDLLLRAKLHIVGEEVLQINFCLAALDNIALAKIRRVLSQWQALAQCSRFLSQLENCQRVPVRDTGAAVQQVVADQDLSQAAIAGEDAARLHGLHVLERNIGDQPETLTRFIVVAAKPIAVDTRIPAKTSMIMATAHESGALMKALVELERHGINMTKLESRPRKGARFEYLFYLDFEGNIAEPRVEDALAELRNATSFLKILGSYPIYKRDRTAPTLQAMVQAPEIVGAAGANGLPAAPRAATTDSSETTDVLLASRAVKARDTVIRVQDVSIGLTQCVIFAGPEMVESEQQIDACARHLKECGGHVLCGGCFRPSNRPFGFPGLETAGLQMLVAAARRYDLPCLTEVNAPNDIEQAVELADILMVGHQNMRNFSLLAELGQLNRPVMLRRGRSASLEQLLVAADYVLQHGNQQVMLCEHGIRTFETATGRTLDLGGISILKSQTHLPIVVDPSHATEQPELIEPLTLAAHAIGPHGMMFNIHPDPVNALSDGPQALSFDQFRRLIARVFCEAQPDEPQ